MFPGDRYCRPGKRLGTGKSISSQAQARWGRKEPSIDRNQAFSGRLDEPITCPANVLLPLPDFPTIANAPRAARNGKIETV
jgi:hypothetical protein